MRSGWGCIDPCHCQARLAGPRGACVQYRATVCYFPAEPWTRIAFSESPAAIDVRPASDKAEMSIYLALRSISTLYSKDSREPTSRNIMLKINSFPGGPNSASDIRNFFGANLRQLTERAGSVSETCRRLGINRTQFNRYLNGEAFPRPDVLARICTYFDVDANIMIRPLSEVSLSLNPLLASLHRLADPLPGEVYSVPETVCPTGIYRIWRRSFMWREHALASTCRIWREGNVTCWKTYEPTAPNPLYLEGQPMMPERRSGNPVLMRPYLGYVLNVNTSLCILSAAPESSPVMRMTTLRGGFDGMPQTYAGIATLMQAPQAVSLTTVPVVMQHLEISWRELLSEMRGQCFFRREELPPRLARYLFDTAVL